MSSMDSRFRKRSGGDGADGSIQPDPRYYRFLKFIRIPLPSDSVPQELRDWLVEGRRVRFVRENTSADLRVECYRGPFSGMAIGHIPPSDAEKWTTRMEQGVRFAGWIGPEDCSPGRIRIAVYERIVFPLDDLDSFEFQQGGLFHPFVRVCLSFRDTSVVFQKSAEPENGPTQQVTICFYPKKWEKFVLPALRRCNFPAWRSQYVDPCVCDGISWSMELRFGSGARRRIVGSNDFPEEWDSFQWFLEQCLDMREVKGHGAFSILPAAACLRSSGRKTRGAEGRSTEGKR